MIAPNRPTVLVTGAAKRVGRSLALYFAAKGYDVALHCRQSQAEAETTAAEVRALGVACKIFVADLQQVQHCAPLIAQVVDAFPSLSVLVNNASVFDAGAFLESDAALFEREFSINTQAPIFLTQAFAKQVKKGVVVNMLDTKITAHKHSHFFYLLSKKTLAEFTKMAAVELAPHIRVNGVCPGHVLPSHGWGSEYEARLAARLPMGRIASLDEVVQAVYSLVENTGVTGQFLFIDGGEHLL